MYSQTRIEELSQYFPLLVGILIGLLLVAFLGYTFIKKKDNAKPLETRKVKILEKPLQQGNIEWYIVECDNGERLKLRNLQANQVLISVGDVGTLSFRGQTIQDFKRDN